MDWPSAQSLTGGLARNASIFGSRVTLTTGAGYSTLFAALPRKTCGILVQCGEVTNVEDWLVDIAIGAAASEVIVLKSLLESGANFNLGSAYFPLVLPAGQRLAVKAVSSAGGVHTLTVDVSIVWGGFDPLATSRILTVGDDTGGIGGTGITPGTSANSKGAYSALTASLDSPIRGFCFALGTQTVQVLTSGSTDRHELFLLDIAIGAAAAEQILVPDILISWNDTGHLFSRHSPWLPIQIAAGQRIAARCQSSKSFASGAQSPLDLILYGAV